MAPGPIGVVGGEGHADLVRASVVDVELAVGRLEPGIDHGCSLWGVRSAGPVGRDDIGNGAVEEGSAWHWCSQDGRAQKSKGRDDGGLHFALGRGSRYTE